MHLSLTVRPEPAGAYCLPYKGEQELAKSISDTGYRETFNLPDTINCVTRSFKQATDC